MELRIGVNAGGSFTDFLVVDEAGNAETYKTSTTLEGPSIGFFRGLEKAAYQRGLQLDAFLQVIAFESGDQIQAAKAGLMEIADIFVLNKYDRPGSNTALQSLQSAASFINRNNDQWQTEIIKTVATEAKGIDLLVEEIFRHKSYLIEADKHRKILKKRAEERLKRSIDEAVNDLVCRK